MRSLVFLLSMICVLCSLNGFTQNPNHYYHNNDKTNTKSFAGGLITGLFLNQIFKLNYNEHRMYFYYNHYKKNWYLKKQVGTYCNNQKIMARFENPNGGRDFFVKLNRRGNWFIDAPKKFKKILKRKVIRNI